MASLQDDVRHIVATDAQPQALKGKVALVTGSSAGIGAGIARELSLRGASIVLNYPFASLAPEAEEVGKSLSSSDWISVEADLSTLDGPEKLVQAAVAKFGKIDILVNCAARSISGHVEDLTAEDWQLSMDLNGRGVFLVTKAVLPHFPKDSKNNRIINIISPAARHPEKVHAVYAASKAACVALTRVWALDLPARYNCTVNSVAPGYTNTPGLRGALSGVEDMMRPIFDAAVPVHGWYGVPEDIAWGVAFLAEERSSWINGACINVSGGAFLD